MSLNITMIIFGHFFLVKVATVWSLRPNWHNKIIKVLKAKLVLEICTYIFENVSSRMWKLKSIPKISRIFKNIPEFSRIFANLSRNLTFWKRNVLEIYRTLEISLKVFRTYLGNNLKKSWNCQNILELLERSKTFLK